MCNMASRLSSFETIHILVGSHDKKRESTKKGGREKKGEKPRPYIDGWRELQNTEKGWENTPSI